MSELRLVGLFSSFLILLFSILQRHSRRFRRGDLLTAIVIAASLGAVSLYPSLVDGVTNFFDVPTRPMALAIIAIIVLFGLFLYAQKELSEIRYSVGDLVRELAKADYARAHGQKQAASIEIIIPAYNEEKNLQELLPRLPEQVCGKSVCALVIVDGARDRSAVVARRYAVPITTHMINRGQGDALRTGFDLALQNGAEIVVTMDADGQHQPVEIERLVAPILADEADFVMGSRFAGDYAERGGARHVGIVGFSRLISWLTGVRVSDCTNGFRAIRTTALARLDLRESRFSAPELIMEAIGRGLRIKEVPVTILSRQEGRSKKPRGWRYPLGFAWVILKVWLR